MYASHRKISVKQRYVEQKQGQGENPVYYAFLYYRVR